VTQVQSGSAAAMAGIKPGAVVLQVDRKKVRSAAEFRKAVAQGDKGRGILLLVRQDGMQRFAALKW
jgi:serine protease Do